MTEELQKSLETISNYAADFPEDLEQAITVVLDAANVTKSEVKKAFEKSDDTLTNFWPSLTRHIEEDIEGIEL